MLGFSDERVVSLYVLVVLVYLLLLRLLLGLERCIW